MSPDPICHCGSYLSAHTAILGCSIFVEVPSPRASSLPTTPDPLAHGTSLVLESVSTISSGSAQPSLPVLISC